MKIVLRAAPPSLGSCCHDGCGIDSRPALPSTHGSAWLANPAPSRGCCGCVRRCRCRLLPADGGAAGRGASRLSLARRGTVAAETAADARRPDRPIALLAVDQDPADLRAERLGVAVRPESACSSSGTNQARPLHRPTGAGSSRLPASRPLRVRDPLPGLPGAGTRFRVRRNGREIHGIPVRARADGEIGVCPDGSLDGRPRRSGSPSRPGRPAVLLTRSREKTRDVAARLSLRADVAELVDAHGSGPCALRGVEVQVLSSASQAAG
jgi:hypothetical protein